MKIIMIEQLSKINKIYDLLALCASYIFNEYKKIPYQFSLFNDDEFDCVYEAIERYCTETKDGGHKKAFDELREYLIFYMGEEVTVEKCFAVVKYIDELIEVKVNDKLSGGGNVIKYTSLNKQYNDCVRIIPKSQETILERADIYFRKNTADKYSLLRKKRDCPCSPLDVETLYYMIWDKKHIEAYPDMCIYHLDEKHPITKHFQQKEELVFGIIPFTNKRTEELLEVKYRERTFYIEQMFRCAEEELRLRYKKAYLKCKENDIDFLIFPEMLITNDIISSIQERSEIESPWIVINGSIWKNNVNKTIVTDSNGTEIFNYCKKEPFTPEINQVEYKEWLDQSKNKEYSIMEIEGLGRIGIGICKDLINEEIKMFHRYIGTNILLVPAYTSSMDLQGGAEELSQEYNCIVVVANACSALEENKENQLERRLGFITMPAKKGTDRTKIVIRYNQNKCTENCQKGCSGKKFRINFYETKKYNEGISYKVEEEPF